MTHRTRLGVRTAMAAVLGGALLLSGCGGSDNGGSDGDVKLTISWWGNDDRAAYMKEVIDKFEASHEGITVVAEPVGAPDDLFNRLATDFASGTAPDVFTLGGAKPQEYGADGALLDLGTVKKQLDTSKYDDATLTSATVDDKLYGLPTGGNAIAALINPKIFEAAGVPLPQDGWTWSDLVETANAISAKKPDGAVGLDLRIQDILGTYVGQTNETGIYDWDGELATDAATLQKWFEMEKALVKGGGLPDPSVITEHWNVTPDQSLFGTGKAAMTFAYSNQVTTYGATLGTEVKLMAPPTDTGKEGVAALPSQYWAIAAESKHPKEAAELVDYLLNDPEAAAIIKADRGLPFNPDTLATVAPLLTPIETQAADYLKTVLDAGVVAPPQPAGGEILNELSQRMESDVLFGKASPAEAAKKWVAELSASLDKA